MADFLLIGFEGPLTDLRKCKVKVNLNIIQTIGDYFILSKMDKHLISCFTLVDAGVLGRTGVFLDAAAAP